MKTVIRWHCFESNSSSSHSFIVTKNDVHVRPEELCPPDDKKYDPENFEEIYLYKGKWRIYQDISEGYGRWPFQFLTTFKDKFLYALCEYCGCYYPNNDEFDKNYERLVNIAKEIVPGLTNLKINMREFDIYLDKNGNEIPKDKLTWVRFDKDGNDIYEYEDENGETQTAILDTENVYEYPDIGTIDHQSAGLLKSFLKKKGISLKEFLTNKKYVICVDGDEYCDLGRLLASGLIDKDYIEEMYGISQ